MELPKALITIIELLKKTRGRDKLIRLFQYTFRFLTELAQKPAFSRYFKTAEARASTIENFRNIGNAAASTRKLFRFTKHLDIFLRVKKMLGILTNKIKEKETKPEFYYILKILSDISLFLYYILDHFLYLYFLEVFKKGKSYGPIAWYSDFCWLIESICDVATSFVDGLYHLKAQRLEQVRKSGLEVILYVIDSLVG